MQYQPMNFLPKWLHYSWTKTLGLLLLTMLILSLLAYQAIRPVNAANVSNATTGTATPAAKQALCTLATLKGRYLFAGSGTILPPAFGVTEPTPGADAGFHIFNGDGTGTDIVTVRIGSKIMLQQSVTPITYTVKADCTGNYTVPKGPSFDLFIAPTGDAIATISTAPPGNYVARIDQRVSSK